METPFTALVLAGTRPGGDPFAQEQQVAYKAQVRVSGRAMLSRVVESLRASSFIGQILISGMDRDVVAADPQLAPLLRRDDISFLDGEATPASSVIAALQAPESTLPLLVTTGDHALLMTGMVDEFCRRAIAYPADVVAGAVRESVVRFRYPNVQRTFTRLRDGSYKGTNLFALLTPEAHRAPDVWRQVEQYRKHPWRMVSFLGPLVLLRFLLRRLTLDDIILELERIMNLRIRIELLPFPDAALDVDSARHLELAEKVLIDRR